MKTFFLNSALTVSMMLAHGTLLAQPAPAANDTNSGPTITFSSSAFNFGKVIDGELVKHDYVFTNTGNATLEIKDVHPSCGCTTPGNWTRRVEPGQKGIVPLQFNSTHFNGMVNKTATVTSNDKQHPTFMLRLSGEVWKPISVRPEMAVFNAVVDSPTAVTSVVHIANSLDEPLTLSDPESDNKAFTAALTTINPGKEFELTVSTVGALKTTQRGSITIKTSSTKVPILKINTLAFVQPAIAFSPMQISLPPGSSNSTYASNISIKNNRSESLVLSEPSVNADGVSVELRTVQPGKLFIAHIIFPVGFTVPQGTTVMFKVKTSDPDHPLIEVPVHQTMPFALRAMQPHLPPPINTGAPAPQARAATGNP